jgi:molybdate transport system regulatory protein
MTKVSLQMNVLQNENLLFTPDRVKLLKLVKEFGSLLKASSEMKISYSKAWTILSTVNTVYGKCLIEKKRGGTGGGGAKLTTLGLYMLEEYEAIQESVAKFEQRLNAEINM